MSKKLPYSPQKKLFPESSETLSNKNSDSQIIKESLSAMGINFIRSRVDQELQDHALGERLWIGRPATAPEKIGAKKDIAKIRTRFPPEPNGYLHIGHAKSIWLNFSLAQEYSGRCHMRFDDTNPEKENQEYVDSILESVNWLGYKWSDSLEDNLYYTSDYFDCFYEMVEWLIAHDYAYVDSQSGEDLRVSRGTLTEHGKDSPFRTRSVQSSQKLLREMRDGEHPEGSHVVRAKIDMKSPVLCLRDPILYRIRYATHHRTKNKWHIYPLYDFAHPISDALENVTHSICTLEFENHRPLYNWILEKLSEGGFFTKPLPQQIEFARLNLTYIITSKRKLHELVSQKVVDGWDDPRMPTIVGLRRRGYTPEAIVLFCSRSGVSKSNACLDYSLLEQALRDDLEQKAYRATAVLSPLKLTITNFPEGEKILCRALLHPTKPELGERTFYFMKELWIEEEDFEATPPKGFFRLYPGNLVRLRHGYVVRCTGYHQDAYGKVTQVFAEYLPDSQSGCPGADRYKIKGNIHWLAEEDCFDAEVRLYDRLFLEPNPDLGDYQNSLNPNSKKIVYAKLETFLKNATPETSYQFERVGYVVVDRIDSFPGNPIFNLSVPLKDKWGKKKYS